MCKKILCGALAAVSFFVIFTTCKIGLGESVDTEPPRIKFTSPDTSAVVRGTIDLKGSCTDERKVNTVKVTLTSVDQEKILINGAGATVNNLDSSWNYLLYSQTSSEFPSGAVILPDGKYEAKAVAYDDAGHASGEASRAFEIDGTPPVVALSKPASVAVVNSATGESEIKNPSSFGRNIKIRGLISDDHSISKMRVRIFKEDGTEITLVKSEFSDFDPSDTSVSIARYFNDVPNTDSEDYKLYQNFKAIYGVIGDPNWNKKQNYYAIIEVTDKAGNTSERTYLKTNLLTLVKDIAGQELEMADLKNILNGTYKGSLPAAKVSKIKAVLDGTSTSPEAAATTYLANEEEKLTLSVDSRANPTYEAMGGYAYTEGQELRSLEQTGTLNFRATYGLDETEFRPSGMSIKLIKLSSSTSVDDEETAANSVTVGPDLIFTADGSDTVEDNNIPTDTGTYTLKLTEIANRLATEGKQDFLASGQFYRLEVLGLDEDGNDFIASNDNIYAFGLKSTSLPSDANCDKNKTYVKASDFNSLVINVTDEINTSQIDVKAWVKYYPTIVTTADFKSTDPDVVQKYNDTGRYPGPITINFTSSEKEQIKGLGVGTVVVKVHLDKNGAQSTDRYFYIYTDALAPEINFTNTELQNSSAIVYVYEDHSRSSASSETSSYYWDNGKYTVRGIWNDMYSGQEGSGGTKLCYSFDENPVIGSGTWILIEEKEARFAIKAETSWESKIPVAREEQGNRKLSFYAEDAVGNKTEIITFDSVIFDFSAPIIKYINSEALEEYYAKNTNTLDLSFNVSDSYKLDSDKPYDIVVKKDGVKISSGYEIVSDTSGDEKNKTFTLKFYRGAETNSGHYEISATVKDAAIREVSKINYFDKQVDSLSFIIDAKNPVYKDGSLHIKDSAWDANTYYDNDTLAVSAEFTEDIEMDTLYYWIKTSEYDDQSFSPTDLTVLSDSKAESFRTGQKTISFTASGFKNNIGSTANTLYIQGKDRAGNLSDVKGFKINLDTTLTNIGVGFYKVDTGKLNVAGGTVYVNGAKPLTIYGYYDDNQSGVEELILHIGNTEIPSAKINFSYSATEVTRDQSDVITPDWIATAEAAGSQTPFKEYSKFGDKTIIKTWKAVYTPTKSGTLTLFGKNGAERECTSTLFTISFDTDLPEFNNISFNTSSTINTVYEDGSTYWVNNKNQTFTFAGIATDTTGVESVILNIGGTLESDGVTITGGTNHDIDSGEGISASRWKFSGINLSSLSEQTSAILKATDIAGNEFAIEYTIKFDTAAPAGNHVIDGKGKDLYFRIGNNDNDEILPPTEMDKKVGGKYSNGTYGNSTNVQIRGKFDDKVSSAANAAAGSGVSMIYYKLYDTEPTELSLDPRTIIAEAKDRNQYFAPLETAETKRVFYTADGTGPTLGGKITEYTPYGTIYYTSIDSTYNHEVTGFKEGNDYLVLVAVDKVGNAAIDIAKDVPVPASIDPSGKKDFNNFALNVDVKEPVVSSDYASTTIYSNGTTINGQSSFTITGTVTDQPDGSCAGVSSMVLTVKVGTTETEIQATIDAKTEDNPNPITSTWQALIPASLFASATGNITVYGTAKDNAGTGNSTTPASMATITVDRIAPTVTITVPDDRDVETDGTQVNGKINLSGKISNEQYLTEDDESSDGTMVLYYTTSDTLGAKTGEALKTSGDYIEKVSKTVGADSKWVKFGTTKHASVWEFADVNTRELKLKEKQSSTQASPAFDYIPDLSTLYFTVTATDKAGNIGYAVPVTVKIDQDTDRPIITFSNLTLIGKNDSGTEGAMTGTFKVWTKNDTLYGTATDDDGIKEVYIVESVTKPTSWGTNIYSNGAWEKNVSEGSLVLWFKIKDAEDGEYISSTTVTSETDTALLATPKLRDKATIPNYYGYKVGSGITSGAGKNVLATTVYVQVDTENPKIGQNVYYTFDNATIDNFKNATDKTTILASPEDYGWNSISKISGEYIGGQADKKKIYILYNAYDTNGIYSTTEVFGKINDVDNPGTKVYPETQSSPYTTTNAVYWQIVSFELDKLESSTSVNMILNVTDRAERTLKGDYYFAIDNEAPTVEFRNRSDGDTVYGSLPVSVTGRTTETRSKIKELYFGVTKDSTPPADNKWQEFGEWVNTTSWTVTFDGGTNSNVSESTAFHTKKLNDYIDEIYGAGVSDNNDSADLYLWVYGIDTLGNSGKDAPIKVKLDVLTKGDKPNVEISYPSSGATVSSNVRLAGTSLVQASDAAVDTVWIQIDPTYDAAAGFNENWATELQSVIAGYDVDYEIETVSNTEIKKGIKADGTTQSWNKTINDLGELNSKIAGEKANIAIRIYAVSKSEAPGYVPKVSNPTIVTFTIDPNAPEFSELILINKDDSTKVMKYSSGMWINGEWYLTGSITHSAGIKQLSKSDVTTLLIKDGSPQAVTGVILTENSTPSSTTDKNWDFKILVGSSVKDAIGEDKFTLTAKDGSLSGITSAVNVDIKFDNKAPSAFSATTFGGEKSKAQNNTFKQFNGTFTVKGTVEEGGTESGFKRAAFYFIRELTSGGTTTRYFIDPMLEKNLNEATDKKGNFVKLGTVSEGTFTPETGIVYDKKDGLYWFKETGKMENTNQLTLTSVSDHIRIGGLCKIDNVIYSIYDIDINNKVLTINGEFRKNLNQEVYFAYAQVIDNEVKETGVTDIYNKALSRKSDPMDNGDGDQMNEGISAAGTTYTWEASINSKNILDGPVTLNFSYFDAAGNGSTASYSGTISNNAPRLAGVSVATDYNGNGTYEESEENAYWVANTAITSARAKRAKSIVDGEDLVVSGIANSAFFTLKDKSEIRPEIIGGNGKLYYSYKIGPDLENPQTSGDSGSTPMTIEAENPAYAYDTTLDDEYMKDGSYIRSRTAKIVLALDDFDNIPNSESGKPTWFEYTIWDETDGTTIYTNSQNATLRIALDVKVHDSEKPSAEINPFFWESESKNSLYGNSKKNGHIELEKDLNTDVFDGSSDLYDTDPKVSGKIVVRGTAKDNIRLKKLDVQFTNHSVLKLIHTAAIYDNGNWVSQQETLGDDGWAFTAKDKTYDETGHTAEWELVIDTEFLESMTGLNKNISITATDVRGEQGSITGGLTSDTSSYQVDVVPYITEFHTGIRNASGLKDSNIRSAEGKYSILANNTANAITVNGFNFKTGNMTARIVSSADYKDNKGNTITTSTGKALTITASDAHTATITNSGISSSGYLELFSGADNIRALNNVNDNNSHDKDGSGADIGTAVTDYKNYYNREADYVKTSNVQLTDDRYLRFFDMKATTIKNGYYPNMIMDGNDPVFAYVDLNGNNRASQIRGFIKSAYQTQRTKFSGTDASFTDITYLEGAISSDQMVMAKDEAGKYIHATVYNYNNATMDVIYNDYAEDHRWNNNGYTDGWAGGTGYSGYEGVYSYEGNNNAIALESTSFGNGTLIGRYQNLRMIAKGKSTTTTGASIYMAYYDDNTTNKDIIFRTFKIGTNDSWTNRLNTGNTGTKGAYSNLADQDTEGRITVGSKASKYLDLGVTANESDKNKVVIVYYNVDEACLQLKYSDVPIDGSTTTPTINWKNAKVTFPSYVGTDVSMVIDSDNGIHIAAFDANDSDLVYMYMPSYDSSTLKVCRVDQAYAVGTWTRIALKESVQRTVPYIAYYNSSEAGGRDTIKLAFFADETISVTTADEADIQGCDSNGYTTGKWEYMTVPAITPPQGSDSKFKQVNLDFDTAGRPVVGYLGTTLEFGKWYDE